VNKGAMLYEGKGKKLFFTEDENLLISEFKDDLTAFNAEKKGNEAGKGALNCKISTQLFHLLEKHGIKTHLVKTLDDTHQLIKKVKIIPIEVVVRNIATGSLAKRLGIKDGTVLPFTLVEFYYKDDALVLKMVRILHLTDRLQTILWLVSMLIRLSQDSKELNIW
jgi:phosphoribosylaminoimidazole-succinocarboxamide synthase